ncbi:MAG TPA: thiamine pyrophosphate-binding protein [Terriglobales bacterium]|nr:thiamine pyrophosphate-binding protein [Terriglobales bacterium]
MTVGERIVAGLKNAGVQRLFGMPGGGSNAELIETAARLGLPFSLAHTETAAAFMACAQAEITGAPGACIATLGPGSAAIMNGVAHAFLDRVPLAVITDCYPQALAHMQHQNLRNGAMFAAVTKFSAQLSVENAGEVLTDAMHALADPPPGPVHLDVSAEIACSHGKGGCQPGKASASASRMEDIPPQTQQLLRQMRRPVFLIGLGARTKQIAAALRELCEARGIPALVTYKAKGVVPDRHAWFGGLFTNGASERDILQRADGLLAVGLDPVELLPVPWRFSAPVVSINPWPIQQRQIPAMGEFVGDVPAWLTKLAQCLAACSDWSQPEISGFVKAQRAAMRPRNQDAKMAPHGVVEVVAHVYPGARVTVDAGAHMFPVMSLWPASEPCSVLISNGLSTMGFALPSAIGAALLDPSQPTMAFTGDGGLMMCLGELRTAARENLPVRIIVFDDGVLSLIKVKQMKRGFKTNGVSIGDMNWGALAGSMGVLGRSAATEDELFSCLRETASHPGPVLIAAKISEETYPETIRVLRG